MRDVVRDLMTQHSSEAVLALTDIEYATKDKDLAAGNDKGVLLLVRNDVHLPAILLGTESGMRDEAIQDSLHHHRLGVPGGQHLAAVLLHDFLVELAAGLLFKVLGDDVEATAVRDGDFFEV